MIRYTENGKKKKKKNLQVQQQKKPFLQGGKSYILHGCYHFVPSLYKTFWNWISLSFHKSSSTSIYWLSFIWSTLLNQQLLLVFPSHGHENSRYNREEQNLRNVEKLKRNIKAISIAVSCNKVEDIVTPLNIRSVCLLN